MKNHVHSEGGIPHPSMTKKVRISRTVQGWLDGTALFQAPEAAWLHGYGHDGVRLVEAVRRAKRRADGSVHVILDDQQQAILYELAEAMAASSRDDAGWDADARGDLNAARALLRALA